MLWCGGKIMLIVSILLIHIIIMWLGYLKQIQELFIYFIGLIFSIL